ncbi:MAG: hypothetical protein P8175_07490 [Deltaproteobacteria bacterium]
MKLYWITTEDHAEDWFVVAHGAKEAVTFHEDVEGYEPGEATAEMVKEIPDEIAADVGWPSDEVLRSCGANLLAQGPARIVEIAGRKFCEGLMESTLRTLDDDLSEAHGKGRPNKTKKPTKH